MENSKAYVILQTYSEDGEIALIRAGKNGFGFWWIENIQKMDNAAGFTSMLWHNWAGIRKFGFPDKYGSESEWHGAYCGNNAIKEIQISPDQLPSNCAINIQQVEEFYLIHIIRFSHEGINLDLYELLKENGCIASESTQDTEKENQ